jgi:CO/xanthine dehydrogenase Mo-binding subunit
VCQTALSANTSMRAPGVTQSLFAMESILDQVAAAISMDPVALRVANFIAAGETTIYGEWVGGLSWP